MKLARELALIFALFATPLVLLFGVISLGAEARARGTRERVLEHALDVIKSPPSGTPLDNAMRAWAVDVLDHYSGVPIAPWARAAMTGTGSAAAPAFAPTGTTAPSLTPQAPATPAPCTGPPGTSAGARTP